MINQNAAYAVISSPSGALQHHERPLLFSHRNPKEELAEVQQTEGVYKSIEHK